MSRHLLPIVVFMVLAAACSGRAGETTSPAPEPNAPASTVAGTTTVVPQTPQSRFVPNPPGAGETACDRFTDISDVGSVAASALTESSGIVASRTHDGVFWLHNDSGGGAVVYAIDESGAELGVWTLDGIRALDWEDIAIGPGPEPGVDYLYVGDIGDNLAFRPDVTVHRFPEPDPTMDGTVTGVVALRLGYPTPPIDAEAMFVDPVDGDLVIVTKTDTGRSSILRAAATDIGSDPIIPLFEVATLDLGGGAFVTAADISPDGTRIALRGYEEVWMWPRNDRDLAMAFVEPPCAAPSPDEVQGEALAFVADGTAYVTVSEGTAPTVWRVGP